MEGRAKNGKEGVETRWSLSCQGRMISQVTEWGRGNADKAQQQETM